MDGWGQVECEWMTTRNLNGVVISAQTLMFAQQDVQQENSIFNAWRRLGITCTLHITTVGAKTVWKLA